MKMQIWRVATNSLDFNKLLIEEVLRPLMNIYFFLMPSEFAFSLLHLAKFMHLWCPTSYENFSQRPY